MTPPRILLVDDDPVLLHVLPETLEIRMPEIMVDTATSGASALGRMAVTDYDAIVTDIKMPGMDGLALLEKVRSFQPDLPTLLITGHGEHDLAVQALRGGAFDLIQKPIDRDYLVASLNRAIRVRQLHRQVEEQRKALERHATDLERTVDERTRELREASRAKDEFLASLGHELRNPLTPIRNAVHIMRSSQAGEQAWQRAREIIERQVSTMARLIDDLLDVSRIQSGRVELRREALDLATAIEHAVETCTPLIRARHHELAVSLPPKAVRLYADPTRLEQVVTNLLQNAAKYTEPRGRIELSATRSRTEAIIRVRDNGVGIAPEMLPRIFDLFTQAEQSLARPQGGLGIGLTLVRHLVQMHGGVVTASSEGLGKGSEFVARLPLHAEEEDKSGDDQQSDERFAASAPDRSSADGLRILVIEDDADSRETLRELLRLWGHRVDVAADGVEGIEKTRRDHPRVLLVDIGLPGMDGYQVARAVRAAAAQDPIYLVALTGYGKPEDRERALEAGFDAHLVKPVSPQKLNSLLADLSAEAQS